jgi:hypothetical protein
LGAEDDADTGPAPRALRAGNGLLFGLVLVLPPQGGGNLNETITRESLPGHPVRRPIPALKWLGNASRVTIKSQYRCLRTESYEFMGFGAMNVTKTYTLLFFGDIHGPKPYEFIGFRWAFISQTQVFRAPLSQ